MHTTLGMVVAHAGVGKWHSKYKCKYMVRNVIRFHRTKYSVVLLKSFTVILFILLKTEHHVSGSGIHIYKLGGGVPDTRQTA